MVATGALAGLALAGILALGFPFLAYFICRRRMTLAIRNIAVGVLCFVVFVFGLESSMHLYVLGINTVTAAWLKAHKYGYAIYGALAAGVFEETGRFVGMRFLARRRDGVGEGVAYGIGHGGAEAILIGCVGFFQAFAFGLLLNQGKLDAMIGKRMPAAALAQLHANLEHLTFISALPGAAERASALIFQIALSLLVWRAITLKRPSLFLLAILAHASIDIPAGLIQTGVAQLNAWQVEGIYGIIAIGILGYLFAQLPPTMLKKST